MINRQSGEEDRPRIDYIAQEPLPAGVEEQVLERLREAGRACDCIFVSDQAETGQAAVVTPAVRRALEELGGERPAPRHMGGLASARARVPQGDLEAE